MAGKTAKKIETPEAKVTTPKATEPKLEVVAKKEGTKVKLSDLKPVKLTQAVFGKLNPGDLYKLLCTPNRLSEERAKDLLVDRIKNEKLNSITPEAMMNWTYSSVRFDGVKPTGPGFSAEHAKKNMTKKEFGELDAAGKAALINEFTHKRRAAGVILPALIKAGLPLTAEDVVSVTCGRVEIEGVTVSATRKETPVIVEGITFG
jgi:hypothetical protein